MFHQVTLTLLIVQKINKTPIYYAPSGTWTHLHHADSYKSTVQAHVVELLGLYKNRLIFLFGVAVLS
jgi:hypothetical protein